MSYKVIKKIDDVILKLSPEVKIRPETFGGLLFHRPSLGVFVLNAPAYRLLSKLDGKHTLPQIAGVKTKKCEKLVKNLLKKGWLEEVTHG